MKNYIIAWIFSIIYLILTLLIWNLKITFFISGIHFGMLILWGLQQSSSIKKLERKK